MKNIYILPEACQVLYRTNRRHNMVPAWKVYNLHFRDSNRWYPELVAAILPELIHIFHTEYKCEMSKFIWSKYLLVLC